MAAHETEDFEVRCARAKRCIRDSSFDGIQRRAVAFVPEVRALKGGAYQVRGTAAVFNSLSENLGGFREEIVPGAFGKVLGTNPDVRALFNHDPNLVLARTTNNTLRLEETEDGLVFEADVAPTSYGLDLRVLLERGDVNQSSFAFRLARGGDSWEEDEESGLLIRTIHEFSGLYDVSPVTYPAYQATDAELSSSPPDAERTASAYVQEQGQLAASGTERADAYGLEARRRRLRLLA